MWPPRTEAPRCFEGARRIHSGTRTSHVQRQFLQSLLTFGVLFSCYGAYALVAVPLLMRPPARVTSPATPASPPEATGLAAWGPHWKKIFPAGSWELDRVNSFKTQDMLLLWRRHETVEGSRLKVEPLTIVVLNGRSAASPAAAAGGPDVAKPSRVWIVKAPAGAILQFDRNLDVSATRFGNFQAGFIPGSVHAQGIPFPPARSATPTSTPPAKDSPDPETMELLTQNLQFDERHVWTSQDVEFRWGSGYGSGRDLTISLANIQLSDGAESQASWVESVRLLRLKRLHLMLPGGPEGEAGAPGQVPVDVSADGPLTFHLQQGVAQIQRNVLMERRDPQGGEQRLRCDQLELRMTAGRKSGTTENSAGSGDLSSNLRLPSLRPRRLILRGTPAVLEMTAAESDRAGSSYRMEAAELDYELGGTGDGTTDPGTLVAASPTARGKTETRDAGPTRARALGPGRFVMTPSANPTQPMEVSWQRLASWVADPTQGVLNVEGNARAVSAEQGSITAERLTVVAVRDLAATKGPGWQPSAIRAEQQVHVDSPFLQGNTEQLAIRFVPPAPAPAGESTSTPLQLRDAQSGPSFPSAAGDEPSSRLDVRASQVQVVVEHSASMSRLRDATLRGRVQCQELPAIAGTPSRFAVEGDEAHLAHLSPQTGTVDVVGQPALLRASEVELTGPNVHLDVASNRAWIDGAGQASVPVAQEIAGQIPQPAARATLTWNERLDFDGQFLVCQDGISIRGPLQLVRGDVLRLKLAQPIHFDRVRESASPIRLESTEIQGHVFVENRTLDANGIASIESGQLQELAIEHPTGSLRGQGPGWVETIRRSRTTAGLGTTSDPTSGDDSGLAFVRAEFQRGLTGNLQDKEVRFFDHVRAVYGPVDHWSRRVSASRREELPPGGLLMRCQELVLLQGTRSIPGMTPLEIIARGNTAIEGASFIANADRLSYDQAKDLLVLEGTDRSDAHIWYKDPTGLRSSEKVAKKLEFWPKSNRLKVDDLRFLEFRTRSPDGK